ncbi:hypothetical protein EST38_g7591 [Candolleomyces aberdarensis]|uniref:Ricin B lectin domain-containing protein n=1 Tax=Candolleomyces aberdarensis TaxID=2316362 RepID=A0A4Q2DGJ6_9AGAR|nr:hypothetical protein EST38_g7591 [Candolleomyces aberdarensis]
MANVERGRRYRIVNAKSGTVVDLSAKNGVSIAGWNFHGGQNQIWEASEEGGFWHFKNVSTGKYLALENNNFRDGLKAVGSDNRYNWHIWPDQKDASVLRICVPNTVFNLDLSNHGDSAGGTPIEIWGRWEGRNQCWSFIPV